MGNPLEDEYRNLFGIFHDNIISNEREMPMPMMVAQKKSPKLNRWYILCSKVNTGGALNKGWAGPIATDDNGIPRAINGTNVPEI